MQDIKNTILHIKGDVNGLKSMFNILEYWVIDMNRIQQSDIDIFNLMINNIDRIKTNLETLKNEIVER